MNLTKVSIRKLNIKKPPLDNDGGRIITDAGEIAQIVSGEMYRYLAYIEFEENPNIARGNHYHDKKEEYLYIIKGNLKVIYEDVDNNERQEIILTTGDLVIVKPRCAHVYYPLSYTQAIEFSRDPFDPHDTYKYIIN